MPVRRARPVRAPLSNHGVSLRSRWNRAFILMTAFVVVSGVAGLVGTSVVVGIFRGSAVRAESEATMGARLRSEVVAQSVLIASAATPAWRAQVEAARATIAADFRTAIRTEDTPAAKSQLTRSESQWLVIARSAGTEAAPTTLAVRGAAVSTHAPAALASLDQAAVSNRHAVQADLAHATRIDRTARAALALLDLFVILLAIRLSSRLSSQVLGPLDRLRDSANRLAAGQLDHRVQVDREDELGELGVSFNAMADAIAGSNRSLTLEANSDALTGLANRVAFTNRLTAMLATDNRRSSQQAVLFIDLDDFKDVNDTLGHAAGDELLRVVGARLRDVVRPSDLVARLGGDEFALVLDEIPDPDFAWTVAQRIVTVLAEPLQIGANRASVGASVGLTIRGTDSTPVGLMREADVAMYAAKAGGKNRVERYDARLDDQALARHILRADLEGAAGRGEFILDYQPIVDLHTGMVVGLEALARWQHPTRGLLPPSEFIDMAEQTGAIVEIGEFVLREAAAQVQSWQCRYQVPELWLSVNVSVSELDSDRYAAKVSTILRDARLDPTSLVVEVTETQLVSPRCHAAATLEALRQNGIRVALDDFGTGYASIAYLRELSLDILKIDRSFVAGARAGDHGHALLEAIVAMADRLDLVVIPEGIEQIDQVEPLRDMGCRFGQGFLLSRPVPSATIESMLAARLPLALIGLEVPSTGDLAVPLR